MFNWWHFFRWICFTEQVKRVRIEVNKSSSCSTVKKTKPKFPSSAIFCEPVYVDVFHHVGRDSWRLLLVYQRTILPGNVSEVPSLVVIPILRVFLGRCPDAGHRIHLPSKHPADVLADYVHQFLPRFMLHSRVHRFVFLQIHFWSCTICLPFQLFPPCEILVVATQIDIPNRGLSFFFISQQYCLTNPSLVDFFASRQFSYAGGGAGGKEEWNFWNVALVIFLWHVISLQCHYSVIIVTDTDGCT